MMTERRKPDKRRKKVSRNGCQSFLNLERLELNELVLDAIDAMTIYYMLYHMLYNVGS
jgi:hypothetical protein